MRIRATIILADFTRVKLDIVCAQRTDLDDIVTALYPEHRACFTIVDREPACA